MWRELLCLSHESGLQTELQELVFNTLFKGAKRALPSFMIKLEWLSQLFEFA
jgi:hypothetical protein